MSTAIDVEISILIEGELLKLEKPRYWLSATGLARKLKLKQNNNSNWNCLSEQELTSKIYKLLKINAKNSNNRIRWSNLPSPKTLETLWGHIDNVGERDTAPLERSDLPLDVEITLLPEDAPIWFISHNHRDLDSCLEIKDWLATLGIATWLSECDISRGHDISKSIITALNKCDGIILALSVNSISSTWVYKEVFNALTKKIPCTTVIISEETQFSNLIENMIELEKTKYNNDNIYLELQIIYEKEKNSWLSSLKDLGLLTEPNKERVDNFLDQLQHADSLHHSIYGWSTTLGGGKPALSIKINKKRNLI
jgi:hypothetical protein